MKEKKVTQKMIAEILSGRLATVNYKIQNGCFMAQEAILIKNAFFEDMDIEYLFEHEKKERKKR